MGRSQISLSSWQGKSVLKSLCTLQGSGWLIGQSHLLISRSTLLPLTPPGPSWTSHASLPRGGPPHTGRHCCCCWADARRVHTVVPIPQIFYVKMAKLTWSLLLMQEECYNPFLFLTVSYSRDMVQVTYVFYVAKAQCAMPIRYLT